MEMFFNTKDKNYKAAERALSIALCEMGRSERVFGSNRVMHEISVSPYFLNVARPVLLKYVNENSIIKLIKKAQKIALARRARGEKFWSKVCFLTSVPFVTYHVGVFMIAFLTFLSICAIVFKSRKIVGKIWSERDTTKEADFIALAKMIEECKKSRFRICMEHLLGK